MPYIYVPATDAFVPMGMYCTVTQRYDSSNNTWAQVLNMAPHPSHPGTVMSGNGIVVPAGAQTITARCTWSGPGCDLAIYVNGTKVSDSASLPDAAAETITYSFTAVGGEVVTMYVNPYNNSTASRIVQSGQANTYLITEAA